VSFAVGRAHRCDFFVACLGEQLANRIVNPTARGLLLTDVLNRILLGCVESQSTDLGASAEVSANRIKSAELVCMLEPLYVEFRVVVFDVVHTSDYTDFPSQVKILLPLILPLIFSRTALALALVSITFRLVFNIFRLVLNVSFIS